MPGDTELTPVELVCPHCSASLVEHDHVGQCGVVPEAGDVSVCAHCSEVALFADSPDGGLLLRTPSVAELAEGYGETALWAAREALRACPGDVVAAVLRARCDRRVVDDD